MSARELLMDAYIACGWSDDTMLSVVCDWIDLDVNRSAMFKRYILSRIEEENKPECAACGEKCEAEDLDEDDICQACRDEQEEMYEDEDEMQQELEEADGEW